MSACLPAESNGDLAMSLIARDLKQMGRLHPEVLADQDPEPLHQMRVGFRRLRSTVQQFVPVLILPEGVSNAAMARIGRRLGRPRDLDVLRQRLVEGMVPQIPELEQHRLKGVIKQLRRERRHAFDDLRDTLRSRRYLRLLADLRLWVREPRCTSLGAEPVQDWIPEWLWGALGGLMTDPGWRVQSLEEPEASSRLHGLRKAIKRARYSLANLQEVPGTNLAPWIQRFKLLQEQLGDLNDLDVLETAMTSLLEGDPAVRLPVLWGQMAEARSQAWRCWNSEAALLRTVEGRESLYRLLLAGGGGSGLTQP